VTDPGTLLERSGELASLEEAWAAVRASTTGSLALVAGEAGIGKTTFVRAFRERLSDVPALWGGCEPLFTPRPLGPFADLADQAGGLLASRAAEVSSAAEMATALV
jgi:predicted ATPase